MGFVSSLFQTARQVSEAMKGSAVSGCLPRGITQGSKKGGSASVRSIYCSDSSLLTMFEITGMRSHCTAVDIENVLVAAANAIKPTMKNKGHTIQVCMHHDRDLAPKILDKLMAPMMRASETMGIDIDGIVKDWAEVTSRYTAGEIILVAMWTHPSVMIPAVLKSEKKKMKVDPISEGGQNPSLIMEGLHIHHATAVANLRSALSGGGLAFFELSPEDAARKMRKLTDEEWTAERWKPWDVENTSRTVSLPSAGSQSDKFWLMPESLSNQIVPRGADILYDEMVRIGNRIHYPFLGKLPPQQIVGFKRGFFNEAVSQQFPWRITWTFRGGARPSVLDASIARVLFFASPTNRKLNRAYDMLNEYVEQDSGVCIGYQVSFDTWIDGPATSENIALLRKRQAQFAGTVQAWGTQEVTNITGDPYPAFLSTIPGLNWKSPAPAALAPIEDAFAMLPIADRAASPWKSGMPLRTPDGKIYPYQPMSSEQAAWIIVGIAPMGSGKSVYANVENFSFIFNPDLPDVPYLYIIDVGPSSAGLIRMIREQLPEHKKHLACEFELDNQNPDHTINVFDTSLGVRMPFAAHFDFLTNFLTLLATPVSATTPYDGVSAFARDCIKAAYRLCTDSKPKPYIKGIEPKVDEMIAHLTLKVDQHTTWWEIVDDLFRHGHPILAGIAQRHAVPILEDICTVSSESVLRGQYMKILTPTGENLPEYFYRRIQESITQYAILRGRTKFDIGDARIASIDLDKFKASGDEGAKRMAIMFMVSQQVMAGKFYRDKAELGNVMDLYKDYHDKEIEHIKSLPKRLSMDEVHRITQLKNAVAYQFVADICTRARESRKWGVSFAFWTQIYSDIPQEIIELVTTLYVFGAGTMEGAKEIAKIYDMSPEMADAMFNIQPPGPQGSSMMAFFKTKEGRPYYHILTLTIGLHMLWALSSTKNERNIREALAKEFGYGEALKILVKLYPTNISKIIEERQREYSRDKKNIDAVQEILDECRAYARDARFQ